MILVGSVLWLRQFTIETRVTSELARESEEFTGIDDTTYVFTLFGLPPLVFGACLFSFIASSVPQRTNKNWVLSEAKIYFRIARQRSQ